MPKPVAAIAGALALAVRAHGAGARASLVAGAGPRKLSARAVAGSLLVEVAGP